MGAPSVYKYKGLNEVKDGEANMQALKTGAGGKAKARYPDKPLGIIPGGSENTGSGGPAHKGSYGRGTPNA